MLEPFIRKMLWWREQQLPTFSELPPTDGKKPLETLVPRMLGWRERQLSTDFDRLQPTSDCFLTDFQLLPTFSDGRASGPPVIVVMTTL
jgi:hypothetical protein